MSNEKVLLLLGSDLGDREKNLETARNLISKGCGDIVKFGKIVETEPIGFTSETLFLNQMILISTQLSPITLLDKIKEIEKEMGRVYLTPKKNEKYTSRLIDIDIINYGDIQFSSNKLSIPHHQIETRDFAKEMLRVFNLE